MMAVAVPWLPPARGGEDEAALHAVAARWLAEWIVGPVAFRVTALPSAGSEGLVAEARDKVALGLAACAGRADPAQPGDARIAEAVGAAMVADLDERLGKAGEKPRRFAAEAQDGAWRVALAVGEGFLVEARKAAAGSARRPLVVPLAEALEPEGARIGCHLGGAALTAADVAALSVGDVIVLDRVLGGPVPLTVEGARPRKGQARVEAEAQAIRITITEPLDLLRKN